MDSLQACFQQHRHAAGYSEPKIGAGRKRGIEKAVVTFLRSGGNLSLMVGVTLLRGILSPVGHGAWTAILASVLFRESAAGHFRINGKVVEVYLMVAVLHGLWGGLPGVVSAILSPGFDVFVGQAIVGGISLFILSRRWSEARRLQLKQTTA